MRTPRSPVLVVAVCGGLAQVAAGVAMYVAGVYFAQWSMAVSLGVLLVAIVIGTLWVRRARETHEFRYRDALFVGVAISIATGVLYAVYNVVSINFVYPHFLDDLARADLAMKTARNLPVGSFEQERASLSVAPLAIGNLIRLSVLGSVLSALVAIVLRGREDANDLTRTLSPT